MVKKIMLFFIMVLLLSPAFLQAAKKILASSGWNNSIADGNCITQPWVEKRRDNGEFERQGFKYADFMDLPNRGRDTMQQDIYAVANHINGELNDPMYENIEAFELVGHSKGGVAVNNLAKIIANPDSEEYKYLVKNCPKLMERWTENKYFIENVVTCNAPMNGTFDNIVNIANAPTLTAGMVKDYAQETKTTDMVANLGALDLAKVPVAELGGKSRIDYYNEMNDGYAHRTHLSAQWDQIVPLDSSSRPGKGYNEVIKDSTDHSSILSGDNPIADAAIFKGIEHNARDTSDYNKTPVALKPILKDTTLNGIAGLINKGIKKYDVPIYTATKIAVKTAPVVKQAVEKGKTVIQAAADKTVQAVKTAKEKTVAVIKKTADITVQAAITAGEKTRTLVQNAAERTVAGAKLAVEKTVIVLEKTAKETLLSQTVLSPFSPYMTLVRTVALPKTEKSGTSKNFISRFADGVISLFSKKSETTDAGTKVEAGQKGQKIQWVSLDEIIEGIDSGN